jgi:RimK family alpha-L-glutamate ligase
MSKHVAIAIDPFDWHAKSLLRGFHAAGATAATLRLSEIGFATEAPGGILWPGSATPDGLLVRAVAAGSFEQVTRRLGLLHALGDRLPLVNRAAAIERCVDKSMTCHLLAAAGLPTPASWTVETAAAAQAIRAAEPGPLVLKPLFGAQGRGLLLLRPEDPLPPAEAYGGVYHLQRFVRAAGKDFHDHRILVCRGEPIAAMTRRAGCWITNLKRGGTPEPFRPCPMLQSLAVRAAEAVGADLAGVDLVRDRDGTAFILEVNSMPGWRGLQTVTSLPIAAHIAGAFLRLL